MQIDGHHALTYIVARYAGLEHGQAEKLAYCSQYVDEATNDKPIHFDNGELLDRISRTHKMLDYRNSQELANHLVWIPFHFLPGNNNLSATENPEGSFINKLICRPDSYVARDMLKMIARHFGKPYDIHLMGIAMHVYADTFTHQNFSGVIHETNKVSDIKSDNEGNLITQTLDKLTSYFVSDHLPLGHGASLSLPDRPYLKWKYKNSIGEIVENNNPEIFLDAANAMYKAILCFKNKDVNMDVDQQDDIPKEKLKLLKQALIEIQDEDGQDRHQKWLEKISNGTFGFEPITLTFEITGEKSWKERARGKQHNNKYTYSELFLESDWKYFHDALKTYRIEIIRDVLPKYGICVA